ncbi:MAG: DUF4197 domain-containing protein [Burkholderiales bacterium]|nr:DUF4197 domain-containing protein [Burkholderiales bacterium]
MHDSPFRGHKGLTRRTALVHGLVAAWLIFAARRQAWALSLSDLTESDAAGGIKAALERGVGFAVESLGQDGGFLNNDRVRITLPGHLDQAAGALRMFGQGAKVDELVNAMNHAAEQAVPVGKSLLIKAVHTMSVSDAKGILTGGDGSVTRFFADKTRQPLTEQFLPIVTKATEHVGLADKYNAVASRGVGIGLVGSGDANIQQYVTGKTIDGVYLLIGDEEKKIRQDPIGTGSTLLSKVFGAH